MRNFRRERQCNFQIISVSELSDNLNLILIYLLKRAFFEHFFIYIFFSSIFSLHLGGEFLCHLSHIDAG